MNASGRLVHPDGDRHDDPDPVPAAEPRRQRRRDDHRRGDQRMSFDPD